jgi:hypothetical protein
VKPRRNEILVKRGAPSFERVRFDVRGGRGRGAAEAPDSRNISRMSQLGSERARQRERERERERESSIAGYVRS